MWFISCPLMHIRECQKNHVSVGPCPYVQTPCNVRGASRFLVSEGVGRKVKLPFVRLFMPGRAVGPTSV